MKTLLLFAGLVFGFAKGSAQLTCSFSADTLKGCSPLTVRFTDLSSGGGTIIYRYWDFGNGGYSIGNNPTPNRIYTTPGVYTVRLIVSDGTDTATAVYTNYIRVFNAPTPRFFIYTQTFCRPATFSFADSSLIGDAPISIRRWDFGDLTPPGTGAAVTHAYPFEGTYSVTLTVTDTNGCRASLQKLNAIRIVYPRAGFSVNKTYDCQTPSVFQFNYTGSGRGPMTYKWYFGDGDSSVQQHPAHTYTATGIYTVRMIVSDSTGCRDTLTRTNYIRIAPLIAGFNLPDTLCRHLPDTFFNTTIGNGIYFWSFGDGDTSSMHSPLKSYANSGLYSVKLKVQASAQCIDSVVKTIVVERVEAGYYVTYDSICKPEYVTYHDTSKGNIRSRVYGFSQTEFGNYPNNRKASIAKDTTIKYIKANCTPRLMPDTLMVTTHFGCRDTAFYGSRTRIDGNVIQVNFRQRAFCVPAVIDSFRFQHCLRFSPVSWLWEFIDSTTIDTVNTAYPNHTDTFLVWGQRSGRLWVADSMGCRHQTSFSYRVGTKPHASFLTDKDTLCLTDTLKFRNTSIDSTLALTYNWEFGEGAVIPPVTSRHAQRTYKFCGPKTVRLFVSHFECKDTAEKTIYVSGPMGSVNLNSNCQNPKKFNFSGNAVCGHTRFYWNFGDSSALDSTSMVLQHTYPDTGIYKGVFTLVNDTTGCVYHAPFEAHPYMIKAVIDTSVIGGGKLCAPLQLAVRGMGSVGVHNNKYYWNFGNGQTAAFVNGSPSQTYAASGNYSIRLIIEDRYGCRDTAYHDVSAYGPSVNYSLPNPICHADTFVLNSVVVSPIGLDSMAWVLDSVYQHSLTTYMLSHFVDTSGRPYAAVYYDTLDLKLWVRDPAGCADSVVNQFLVGRVLSRPEISDSNLCAWDTLLVQDWNAPWPGFTYRWTGGNGDTLRHHSGKFVYSQRGDTFLTYQATEPFGCFRTDTFFVNTEAIDSVSFLSSLTDTACYPATIYFSDRSAGDSIRFRYWYFGDGSAPVPTLQKDSLWRIFSAPGRFDIGLRIVTRNGCTDSLLRPLHINITGPFARFSILDDSLCKNEPAVFVLDTANSDVVSVLWDFADGRVDSLPSDSALRRHAYANTGQYTCIFVYMDSLGSCRMYKQLNLVVEDVSAGFDVAGDTAGCTPFNFKLQDRSLRADTWHYRHDEGAISTASQPQFTMQGAGRHWLRQDVLNSRNGCRDSAFGYVLVYPLPRVSVAPDTMICLGDSAWLNAYGAKTYFWTPLQYLSATHGQTVRAAPPSRQTYKVLGVDTNGCENTDTLDVFVQTPPLVVMPTDTQIIIGELVRLFARGSNLYTWHWTPEEHVACPTCLNTTAKVKERTQFFLTVSDSLGCFEVKDSFWVDVQKKYSVDVPEVFTPNGDGINDLIFPAGWGIEAFLEFKIFNRWGELVFEGGGDTWGWNGTYKESPQNPDTYVYIVKVKGYSGDEIMRQGYITLLR